MLGDQALLEARLERVAPVDDHARDQAALGVEVVRRHAVARLDIGVRQAAFLEGAFGHGTGLAG